MLYTWHFNKFIIAGYNSTFRTFYKYLIKRGVGTSVQQVLEKKKSIIIYYLIYIRMYLPGHFRHVKKTIKKKLTLNELYRDDSLLVEHVKVK